MSLNNTSGGKETAPSISNYHPTSIGLRSTHTSRQHPPALTDCLSNFTSADEL